MFNTNVTANFEDTFAREDRRGSGTNIIQVEFDTGITGSVRLFGRVAPDCAWIELTETPITADALFPILPVPFLRAEVTVSTGGGGSANVRVRSALR